MACRARGTSTAGNVRAVVALTNRDAMALISMCLMTGVWRRVSNYVDNRKSRVHPPPAAPPWSPISTRVGLRACDKTPRQRGSQGERPTRCDAETVSLCGCERTLARSRRARSPSENNS